MSGGESPRVSAGGSPTARESGQAPIDVALRYVRIVRTRANGLVEFEFAIGAPDVCIDMCLPREDFEAFCRTQQAVMLDPHQETEP